MGAHRVIVKVPSGRSETGYVLNESLFLSDALERTLSTSFNADNLLRYWLTAVEADEQTKRAPTFGERVAIANLIPRSFESLEGVRRVTAANSREYSLSAKSADYLENRSGAAKESPVTESAVGEQFRRFSAFSNDRRVTASGGLEKGTFGTTAADADAHVRTGMDAVHRYALPNKSSAIYRFFILPPGATRLQLGIAQPAYGEPGGGVEVIFVDGTPANTVYGPDEIPER